MPPFRVLYLDMNSFFASVEQQLDPTLRGRPVAITAVDSDSGACVAASYEAKAYGVKTGNHVRDARRLCPGIVFLPSRHRVYVRFNLAVADVLDRHAELTHIRSVDEFQLALSGDACSLAGAEALVARLKAAVSSSAATLRQAVLTGEFGTLDNVPIHYLDQARSPSRPPAPSSRPSAPHPSLPARLAGDHGKRFRPVPQ